MKNMHKKPKFYDLEEEEIISVKNDRNQRRQHKNWTRAWMEHAHEAEEFDEFYSNR